MFENLDAFAAAVEGSAYAKTLKFSRWGYSLINLAHIFGVALLVGAILPLDLRLMGVWGRLDRTDAVRLLAPIAAIGLVIALLAGASLFTVRADDYVKASLLGYKLCLIGAGAGLAILFHVRAGIWVERATPRLAALHGAASLVCWLGAMACGRLIAYFPN